MSKKFERIKELAEKLKELEDQGEGGEATNAKEKLDALLKKYDLTREDIFGSDIMRVFPVTTLNESSSFMQDIIESVNPNAIVKIEKMKFNEETLASLKEILPEDVYSNFMKYSASMLKMKVALSNEEFIEVKYKFSFFWKEYNRDRQLFKLAFKNKNAPYFVSDVPLKVGKNTSSGNPIIPNEAPEDKNSTPPQTSASKHSVSDLIRMEKMMSGLKNIKYVKTSRTITNDKQKS